MNKLMVDYVKEHANRNYNKDGWDFVVETMEDGDIWEQIKDCPTRVLAIREVEKSAKLWDERRRSIRAEAF